MDFIRINEANNKLTYLFTNKNEEIVNTIRVKIYSNKEVELRQMTKFYIPHWKTVLKDLVKKKYKIIYFFIRENLNNYDHLVKKYNNLGFRTNYKLIPVDLYYKNDQVYRIISMFIKLNKTTVED